MQKLIDLFFIFSLLFLSLILDTSCVKTKASLFPPIINTNCFRYGSNSKIDGLSVTNLGKGFVKYETKEVVFISFFDSKEKCKSACKKSKHYYGCYKSNGSYDKEFGIPKDNYVCWLEEKCLKRTHQFEEFKHKDEEISYINFQPCNYLCNTVYDNRGHCIINKDYKYYCYYKTIEEMRGREKKPKEELAKKSA